VELVKRLHELRDPTREDLFVLLLTWLQRNDTKVQNRLRRLGWQLALVDPMASSDPRRVVASLLVAAQSAGDLVLAAVAATRALDHDLGEMKPQLLTGEHLGIDGQPFRVRPRVAPGGIADLYGAAKDDPTFAVARRMACVPVGQIGDVRVADAPLLPEVTRTRLAGRRAAGELRILVDGIAPDRRQWVDDGQWTRVLRRHDDAMVETITSVLAEAATAEIDLVVLPELALSPRSVDHLRAELRNGRGRHPALVAVGITHELFGPGPEVVNEAVLLDGRGTELLRHRKLVVYQGLDEAGDLKAERLEEGGSISVLATPVGNISLLICRDLFDPRRSDDALRIGYITWLLVPSLSPSTGPHRERASALRPRWITTVVCNTWEPDADRGPHVAAGPTRRPTTFADRRTTFTIEV
jgi:hypothetical protein